MNKLNDTRNEQSLDRMACYTETKNVNPLQRFEYVDDFEAFDFECKFHKLQAG